MRPGDLAWTLIKGPLEVVAGIAYGVVTGVILWYLPQKSSVSIIYRDCVHINTFYSRNEMKSLSGCSFTLKYLHAPPETFGLEVKEIICNDAFLHKNIYMFTNAFVWK